MDDQQLLQETYRLARENNRMLHAMRRNAFWGGLLKFIIYAALLSAPIWFYMTYLNDSVQRMMRAIDSMQQTGVKAQEQISGFEEAWNNLQTKLPAFMRATTTGE